MTIKKLLRTVLKFILSFFKGFTTLYTMFHKVINRILKHSNRIKTAFYISLGFLLNQGFHTIAYWKIGAISIAGFYGLIIPIYLAFIFSALIFIFSFIIVLIFFNRICTKPYRIFYLLLFFGIISQIFGQGIMKASFDTLLIAIFFLNFVVENYYSSLDISHSDPKVLALLHTEISTLLRISITLFIFIWSAMGITFSVQFLQKYYESPLRPYIMIWYGVMIIYLGFCFGKSISYFFYKKMVIVRNTFKDEIQRKKEQSFDLKPKPSTSKSHT